MKPLWPASLIERLLLVAFTAGVVVYAALVFVKRHADIWDPWATDGDYFQAVWHYWRYTYPGLFPSGDLLTDYAFVMHAPPAWWAMMAPLSMISTPLLAAKILNVVGYVLLLVAMFWAVGKRSHPFIGLCAVILCVRCTDTTNLIVGGYARTFGPALAVAFLGAFMAARHRTALVLLVLQAALYPPVVLACGLAYGPYTVLKGPTMRDRLRRMAGMTVAGLLIIGFGEFQSIAAPKWWGPIVSIEEAETMPAWHAGGRIAALPQRSIGQEIELRTRIAFQTEGQPLLPGSKWLAHTRDVPLYAGLALLAMAGAAMAYVRRRRGEEAAGFPWQIPALFVATVCGFLLARFVAFRMYIPYRPLAYVIPFVMQAAIPLAVYSVCSLFRRRWLALSLSVLLSVVPMFLVLGTGAQDAKTHFGLNRTQRPLLEWIAKQPRELMFGGELRLVSSIPLFGLHRVYMNSNLAHPFRKGYYDECERRIRRMYEALYAAKLEDVVQIAEAEHIDDLAYGPVFFETLDPRLFKPLNQQLAGIYHQNAPNFALKTPPPSSVVYADKDFVVVSVAKLKEALAHGEAGVPIAPAKPAGKAPAPAPFIGPPEAPFIGPLDLPAPFIGPQLPPKKK